MYSGRRILPSSHIVIALIIGAVAASRTAAQVPGEVRGRVIDASTSQAVAGARIEVVGRAEIVRSGPDGVFVVRGIEPGRYSIRARAIGYAMSESSFDLSNGRMSTLELRLEPVPVVLSTVMIAADRDRASGATIFDRAAIEASGRRDVGELLATIPGVVVTQLGGPGATSRISIRGSSAGEVLVLMDGVRLNSAISGEADLSRVNLENVERVVVLTGAQSSRYGPRALAGVVDIRTRRGERDASALARAGSWGERDVSASFGDDRPVGLMRVGTSLTTGYRTLQGDFSYPVPAVRGGGTAQRVNSDATSRDVLGALTLDGGDFTTAARGSWETTTRGLAGSIVQPSTTGRERQERQGGGIEGQWGLGARSWTVAADITHETARFSDPAPPFGTTFYDTLNAISGRLSSTLAAERGALSAILGGEVRSLGLTSTVLSPSAPHWQRLNGVWGSVHVSEPVGAAGARVDGEVAARIDESSLIGGAVGSPRAMVSLTRGVIAASVSAASGYAPPSLSDQFFHEGVLVRANPNLRPERTRGDFEGRVAIREAGIGPVRLSGEAALFRADIDGMILWLPDFRFIWSPSNYVVHRSGWELSGRASAFGGGVSLQGNLSAADVSYGGGVLEGQVAYRPRTTANITTVIASKLLHIELSDRYVGARRTVPGSPLNALAPYWLSDVRLIKSVGRRSWNTELSFGVDNVFDAPASMLVDYPFPGRSWTLSMRVRRPSGRSAT